MKKSFLQISAAIMVVALISSCGGHKTNDANKDNKDSVKTVITIENLKSAITGETTASAKYDAFSKKAKEEGFEQISILFKATSKSESIHAKNHLKALEGMGEKFEAKADTFTVHTTKENLEASIKGEGYEIETMYPYFIKTVETDNAKDAKKSFHWAMETEKSHKELYSKALETLNNKKDKSLANEYYVCPKCGNTFTPATVRETCDLCGTRKEKFIIIK